MYTATYIMSASIKNTSSRISTQEVAFVKKIHGFHEFQDSEHHDKMVQWLKEFAQASSRCTWIKQVQSALI